VLLRKFRDDRDWKQFHNPKDLAAAIAIEAGSGFVRLDLMPFQSLLWQAVGVGAMIAFGLIRDLVREMNPPS
jgi:hypothetical protein